jgi:peptide/nickel transport system substrate-binding protein
MPTQMSRRTALVGTTAALAALFPLARASAQSGEAVLRVVAPWEYTSSDPADVGYILTRIGVAETLVQVEPDGKLVGGVAREWSVDSDRLTWRFPIRPEQVFHDGSAVTAVAVAASLREAFAGESLSSVPLAGIDVAGDTVLIRTKTPFSVLPAFLCDYASIVLAPSSYGPDGKVQRIIATGPFRISRVDGKTMLELERFEPARSKARIARLRYLAVENGDTRANIAIAGDADLVFTLAPTAVPRINAAGRMKVESMTIPRIRPIAFNAALPQFSDVRVRRAISMAIDRAGIAASILRHPASAATQLLPPLLAGWHDPSLPSIPYDVPGANRLLDEAGWSRGGDGIRSKGGKRLSAKLLTIANRPELPPMATAIQAQLRQVGMEIAIEAGPTSGIPSAIRDGRMEMTMFARTYVNVPEVIATIVPDYTRERSVWGTVGWPGRDRMKVLSDAYIASFDELRKAELRREIVRLIHEEAPVIPVAWFEHTVAVSSRIRDVAIDPYETRYLVERMSWA